MAGSLPLTGSNTDLRDDPGFAHASQTHHHQQNHAATRCDLISSYKNEDCLSRSSLQFSILAFSFTR